MCFGIPMQVESLEEGFAWVREEPHLPRQRVETKLIAAPKVGDWLLIFIDSAREIISHERALEVKQTHLLLAQAMQGQASANTEVDFALPSQLTAQDLAQFTGGRS